MGDQQIEETGGHFLGMGRIDETGLGGKGVVVEPVQQLRRPGGDDLHLGEMDVGVDEAGGQKMRPVVYDRHAFRRLGHHLCEFAAGADGAAIEENGPILMILVGGTVTRPLRLLQKGEGPPAQQGFGHCFAPSLAPSYQATMAARSDGSMKETLAGGMAWVSPDWR